MIYDCFTYSGIGAEPSLLKIRCEEMKELNCTHILIESSHTFTGIPKDNNFAEQFGSDFCLMNSILPYFYNAYPFLDPWLNEKAQRNMIKDHLLALNNKEEIELKDDDIIILSDLDEIPKAYAIQQYSTTYGLCALQMDMYYYYLNVISGRNEWILPRIMPWSYLKDKQPDEVRRSGFDLCMFQAGWHYCWQGGIDPMLAKFNSFSHQEASVQALNNREILQGKLDRIESLWGPEKFKVVDNTEMPTYVQNYLDEFKHMIYDPKISG